MWSTNCRKRNFKLTKTITQWKTSRHRWTSPRLLQIFLDRHQIIINRRYKICNWNWRNVYRTKKSNHYLTSPKNKNRHDLKNWRPISLLNTDYKIIAKLIANKLKPVLPSIINGDQTGYLKNGYIGENIRLLQDVTFFSEQTRNNIILLSMDFEKEFNSLNWNFLFAALKHVNFGDKIIQYLKILYNNIESTVINNGNTGDYFLLERGVRQGCPLSAYFFILAIKV